jgi:Ca-activated chloride channel family protein
MRFLHPYLLLLLIPLLILLGWTLYRIRRDRRKLKNFGETELVRQLMPDLSLRRKLTKDILVTLSAMLLVFALARPQLGSKPEKVKLEGIEMMVALDLSNSMLAQDVKPSRLSLSKNIVSRMTDELANNKIGLVVFAGEAYIQLPITADFVSAKMFLQSADPSLISAQGTVIGDAIHLATRGFSSDKGVKKALVLITDAENLDGDVTEAIKEAKEQGILISVVGVGTAEGGPIPLGNGEYLTDEEGKVVVTRLDEELAKQIAEEAGGVYIHATGATGAVRLLKKSLDNLQKSDMSTTVYRSWEDVYYYFLIPALILLILDLLLLDHKNPLGRRLNIFERKHDDEA